MSGGDLGSMDFTNPDVDGSFDNLSLEDAGLNAPGNLGGNVGSGIVPDLPTDSPIAGGTLFFACHFNANSSHEAVCNSYNWRMSYKTFLKICPLLAMSLRHAPQATTLRG